MGHVFISYSRRDKDTVNSIVSKLEAVGLDIWIDRDDIRAGRQWRMEIVEAIDTADSFVIHLSPYSAASKNVRKELDLAEDTPDAFVLPVMLEEINIPAEMRYQLAGTQRIAFYADPESSYEELESTLFERQKTLAKKEEPPSHREIHIVIKEETLANFDAEKRTQLLTLLSELTDANPKDLSITCTESDSVRVCVKVPRKVAYALKAIALEEAHLLAKHGISQIGFAGDKNFISIAKHTNFVKSIPLRSPLIWGVSIFATAALTFGAWVLAKRPPPPTVDTHVPIANTVIISTETSLPSPSPTLTPSPTATPTPTFTPTPTLTPICKPLKYNYACVGINAYANIDTTGLAEDDSAYDVKANGESLSCDLSQVNRLTCGPIPEHREDQVLFSVCGPGYRESEEGGLETCSLSPNDFNCVSFTIDVLACKIVKPKPNVTCSSSPNCSNNTDKASCDACGCWWSGTSCS